MTYDDKYKQVIDKGKNSKQVAQKNPITMIKIVTQTKHQFTYSVKQADMTQHTKLKVELPELSLPILSKILYLNF